jgi:hypothetical protein
MDRGGREDGMGEWRGRVERGGMEVGEERGCEGK